MVYLQVTASLQVKPSLRSHLLHNTERRTRNAPPTLQTVKLFKLSNPNNAERRTQNTERSHNPSNFQTLQTFKPFKRLPYNAERGTLNTERFLRLFKFVTSTYYIYSSNVRKEIGEAFDGVSLGFNKVYLS